MKAVVLTATRYSDDSYMANLFTDEVGYVTVSVKTGKRSRVRTSHLQPLSVLELLLVGKPSQKVMRVEECAATGGFSGLADSPVKMLMAQFLAEFLNHALRSCNADVRLFGFLLESLAAYSSAMRGVADFHLVFLVKLTHYLGFFPNLEGFGERVCFDLVDGQFVAFPPLHGHYLPPDKTVAFARLLRADYDTVYLYNLKRVERNEILDYIIAYYRLHSPDFGELRSLDVLRSM